MTRRRAASDAPPRIVAESRRRRRPPPGRGHSRVVQGQFPLTLHTRWARIVDSSGRRRRPQDCRRCRRSRRRRRLRALSPDRAGGDAACEDRRWSECPGPVCRCSPHDSAGLVSPNGSLPPSNAAGDFAQPQALGGRHGSEDLACLHPRADAPHGGRRRTDNWSYDGRADGAAPVEVRDESEQTPKRGHAYRTRSGRCIANDIPFT